MRPGRRSAPAPSAGFVLLALLASLVMLALATGAAATWWAHQQQRERERMLLQTGAAYARALAEYTRRSPGALVAPPKRLEDLLLDTRFVGTVRYIRRLYPDPMQPGQPWGLVQDLDGHILGVYSQSQATPIASRPQAAGLQVTGAGQRYSDWKFLSAEISR